MLKKLPSLARAPDWLDDTASSSLLDVLPNAAYTCDADGLITYFNEKAFEVWGRAPALNDPVDRYCGSFKLYSPDGFRIRHDQCWMALALRLNQPFNGQEIIIERPNGELVTALAHANPFNDEQGNCLGAVNVLVDISERKAAETEIQQLNEALEEQIAERVGRLRIMQELTTVANEARTVEQAMQSALARICDYAKWPLGHAFRWDDGHERMICTGIWHAREELRNSPELLKQFQQSTCRIAFAPGEGMIGKVVQYRAPVWLDDISQSRDFRRGGAKQLGLTSVAAFPVRINGEVAAVLEFFSSKQIEREDRQLEIMAHAGIQLGHVIERKRFEKAITDALAKQQRRFGGELHDSVAQELTGIGMMAETLRQDLAESGSAHAATATSIVEHLQQAHHQVRRLSRGLMPVEVDAEGLMNALAELAECSQEMYGVRCKFHCQQRVTVEDNDTATHAYRVVQEAIQNAVKHGSPSQIDIGLDIERGRTVVTIRDNGRGFAHKAITPSGAGHRIMHYRAEMMGAQLDIESTVGQGTSIVCKLKKNS